MQDRPRNNLVSTIKKARQLTESHCGPATIQMLLSHYGIEVTQEQVVEAVGAQTTINIHGMSIAELALAVKKIAPEMKFWVKRNGTVSDLKKILREYNYPVGIDWQGIFEIAGEYDGTGYVGVSEQALAEAGYSNDSNDGEHGHHCVAMDIDTNENYILLADPYGHYSDNERYIRLQEFIDRWWDRDVRTDERTGKKTVTEEYRSFMLILPDGVVFPEELGMTEL